MAHGVPDLCDPDVLHAVTRRAGLVARHSLGQNFLVDRRALELIVAALEPGRDETVLEIGCGVGTLTGALAERGRAVVAVDLDPRCVRATRTTQAERDNVRVVEGDAMRLPLRHLGLGPAWLAAGNLPYAITTPLLSRLFEAVPPPARGVFLVQREVAARLAAAPGDWSLATVVVRSVASVERLGDLPPESFEPRPRVHSSIIRLRPESVLDAPRRAAVIALARPAFQMRRKVLRHGLTHAAGGDGAAASRWMDAAGVDPRRRPGTLTLAEWDRLAAVAGTLGRQQ